MIYLCIDLGTTSIKYIIVKDNGKILKFNTIKNEFKYFNKKIQYIQNPGKVWLTIQAIFDSILSDTFQKKFRIDSICIIGIGSSLVILNKNNQEVFPVIYAFSDCFTNNYDDFFELYYQESFEKITHKHLNKLYPLPKIYSLKKNNQFKKDYKILSLVDYINYRLTNKFVTDETIASRSLLLNEEQKKWSLEILSILDIDESNLPEINKSGYMIGTIDKEISQKYKFLKDTKIFLGAHDYASAFFAVEDFVEDPMLDCLGTTESLIFVTEKLSAEKLLELNILSESKLFSYKNIYIYNLGITGKILSNIGKLINLNVRISQQDYKNKIIFIPPFRNYISEKKGHILNFDYNTNFEKSLSSIYEGFSFLLLNFIDSIILNRVKNNKGNVLASGKPTKTKEFMQIKANILNNNLISFSFFDISIIGAIKIISKAFSKKLNLRSFLEKNNLGFTIYKPNNKLRKYYKDKHKEYVKAMGFVDLNLRSLT